MKSCLAESIITIFKKLTTCEMLFFFNIFMKKKCRNELCKFKTMEQGFKITRDKKITGLNISFQIQPAAFTVPNKTNYSSLLKFKY